MTEQKMCHWCGKAIKPQDGWTEIKTGLETLTGVLSCHLGVCTKKCERAVAAKGQRAFEVEA